MNVLLTGDGDFTRLGAIYYRLRDELRGFLFRVNPYARHRALQERVSWLEGRERERIRRVGT